MQQVSIRPDLIPLTNHISWAVLFVSLEAFVCLPQWWIAVNWDETAYNWPRAWTIISHKA